MSDSIANLQRKIGGAADLLSVVRTMKAMTASNINQYERSVSALDDYYRSVELGLVACFKSLEISASAGDEYFPLNQQPVKTAVIVFGSDQGLVGKFNDILAEYVIQNIAKISGDTIVWVVGERIHAKLSQTDLKLEGGFTLPKAIGSITPTVGSILLRIESSREENNINEVLVFHNQPDSTHQASNLIYAPLKQRLLPLDRQWQNKLQQIPWPTSILPEVINISLEYDDNNANVERIRETRLALIHEYLFVSLYRACAESLASENASRLAAMQRAEKNIEELLLSMNSQFHILRQNGIDEELFDVVAGFNSMR